MDKKLIFLDVDGTLLLPGTMVPPTSALEAIHAAQQNGHQVFLCTGRNRALSESLLSFGLNGLIASAGAYIEYVEYTEHGESDQSNAFDTSQQPPERVLLDHPMSMDLRDHILEVLHAAGAHCMLETKDNAYGEPKVIESLYRLGDNSETTRWKKTAFRPIREYDGSPVYTIPFVCPNPERLAVAQKQLEQECSVCLYDFFPSDPNETELWLNGEVFCLSCDKGTGVQCICDYLGVPIQQTIGFGDSMNDYAMMRKVATSVCMANGCDELKAISTMICPAVEQDGLAAGFQMLNLIQ